MPAIHLTMPKHTLPSNPQIAVGCIPPRQLWESGIDTLAQSQARRAFERALTAFW